MARGKTVIVRGVPHDLKCKLEQAAQENRTSINTLCLWLFAGFEQRDLLAGFSAMKNFSDDRE